MFLYPGAQNPVLIIFLPLTLSGRHLITVQGTSQCFLIRLPPPSGHYLMMKNMLQEDGAFVLILFSSFLFSGILLCFCKCNGGVFAHILHTFFSSHILLSGLKFDVLRFNVPFLYSSPWATASHISSVTSP